MAASSPVTMLAEPVHQTNDILHWPVLRWASEEFLRSVKQFYVYHLGYSALMSTWHVAMAEHGEPRWYAMGANDHGCLGVGCGESRVTVPTEIVELRGKTLVHCHSGMDHVMVLTSEAELFGWGANGHGQLGIGSRHDQRRPVRVMQSVARVACGQSHTAVVSSVDGSVSCWGCNTEGQLGLGSEDKCCETAQRVKGLDGLRVRELDCGGCNCIALTHQPQRLYHWGQFSFRDRVKLNLPQEVQLPAGLHISAVSACDTNFLTLSTEGQVHYFHYDDDDDQEASGTESSDALKCRLVALDEPVKAISCNLLSIVKLHSGRVAILRNASKVSPLTSITSLPDAYALYDDPVTPRLTTLPREALAKLSSIVHFHNPSNSDLTFYVDGKPIYLDRGIVSQHSPYLAQRLENRWRHRDRVEIRDQWYEVYFTFLQYLHTGSVAMLESEWIGELLALATDSDTAPLRDHCFHWILTNGA